MNIIVRPMILDDYDQVHEVDKLTQRQYLGEKFDQMSEEEQDSHLVSRKSEFPTNVHTDYCFVADGDGKVVGFLLAFETLPFRGTLHIRYVGLNPNIQGKGVGLLLYKKLIEKAKHTGIKEIHALINTDNPNSIRLHEKAGFKLNDRKEAVFKVNL